MSTRSLQIVREEILKELARIKVKSIIGNIASFNLTHKLVEVEHELYLCKILDLCRTGK